MPIVYAVENDMRRSEVETELAHFRVHAGKGGEWMLAYRVTNNLETAKRFADDWVERGAWLHESLSFA